MTEKKVIETNQKNDDKVNIDDIIGIVKTDEPTNSVQLKKEAQLSICEKRLIELEKENDQLKSTLAYRSNQLALMEHLIDDLGSEEMKRQMGEILND